MNVRIRQLGKRFGSTPVLRGVDLEIEDREFFFLLGPSGCGKTTLLRILAGFYEPDEGEVWFGQRRMNGIEPHRRNTGMVFQNYALWPHLTVGENVAYGLDVRGVPGPEKRDRVREALGIVRMEAFLDRSPNQLSGGQQQRVALARALVVRPDVLLLDEPLSNLDARLRLEMRDEIRRIHEQTRVTTVYVTHDQKEALSMADRLAILRGGVVEQIGKPRDLYRSPANRFVAEFIGEMNWLRATAIALDADTVSLATPAGPLRARRSASPGLPVQLVPGTTVDVGFRPEAVRVRPEDASNAFETVIEQVTYLGETEQYRLRVSDGLTIKGIENNPESVRPVGGVLRVQVSPADLLVLPVVDA